MVFRFLVRSWFLVALRKRQVFNSLQFFMGKQWFSVLAALRKKVFCSFRARKFHNAEQFGEDRDKGKFKADDKSEINQLLRNKVSIWDRRRESQEQS
uniref:Uncharacterized protein n=1 Tax=Rhizophagus irregularis (strain DAOM 181602 / DAOM 197198 / MUCL 43194) TaxID=747089 RepID=U9T0J7_RHIID